MIEDKVECINERWEIRVKIIANQVKEMNLGLKEMKAKVRFISVRVDLLTKLPSTLNSTLMPPPKAIVSKTKPNIIKEPTFAHENHVFYIINFKIYYDYENY